MSNTFGPETERSGTGDGWLIDELAPALRRFWLVVVIFGAASSAAGVFFVLKTTVYSASSTLAISRASTSSVEAVTARFGGAGAGGVRLGREDPVAEKLTSYLTSRDFLEEAAVGIMKRPDYSQISRSLRLTVSPKLQQALEYFGLVAAVDLRSPMPTNELVDAITGTLSVSRDASGNLLLTTTLRDKHVAVTLANDLGGKAVDFVILRELREFDQASKYIEERIKGASKEVDRLNRELASLSGEALDQLGKPLPGRSVEIRRDTELAKLRKKQNDSILSDLRRERAELQQAAAEGKHSSVESLQREVTRLGVQADSLSFRRQNLILQGFSETSPSVSALDGEIEKTDELLRKAQRALADTAKDDAMPAPSVDFHIERLVTENVSLAGQIRANEVALRKTLELEGSQPKNSQRFTELTRQITVQYDLMTELYRSSLQFDFQRISAQNKVRLAGKAYLAGAHRKPRAATTIAFAGLVGLSLGGIVALMLDRRRPTVTSRFDLSTFGVPVIGSIPPIRSGLAGLSRHLRRRKVGAAVTEHFFASNMVSFKFLRTRILSTLQATNPGNECRVVTVQSASPSEGKTFVASNLAAAIAMVGKRTLLLDSDILGSRLRERIGCGDRKGLADILQGSASFDEAVVRSIRPNLDILLAGHRVIDSTELLATSPVRDLLASLKQSYDIIVIDTAPVLILPDSLLLADEADAVLLSAMRRRSRLAEVAEALSSISSHRSEGIFFILNYSDSVQIEGAYRYALEPGRRPTRSAS